MSTRAVDSFSTAASFKREEAAVLDRRRAPGLDPFPQAKGRGAPSRVSAPPTAPRALPVEIAFLTDHGVPAEALHYAAAHARRQGVSADVVLLAEGLVAEDAYYRALAAHLDADFIDGDVDLAPSGDPAGSAARGYARLRDNSRGLLWLVAPNGTGVFRLMSAVRAAKGRPLFAVTTRSRFLEALRRCRSLDIARLAAFSAERADPDLCVRVSLRRIRLALAIAGLVILVACLLGPFAAPSLAAALVLAAFFLASVFLRLFACAASFETQDAALRLDDAQAPVYTLVVALYREESVTRQLARAIDRLDYPRAKLDVKFVVEADDEGTAAALRAHGPRAPHEIIVAPPGAPRTKPRALNVAMPFVRGSLVAVYDAEDLPEARQLRRAAAMFAQLPADVACLQASLAIDNGALNWMTSLFAIDYAALFDVHNKGLAAMGLPLFLGGTSNHFRFDALREIGFWDAFNVTEDADLGLRLARAGYGVRTFVSETYEEAPATFAALLKQRTRWLKGWMQTAIVHCRGPLRLVADLGARRAAAVIAMFAGGFLGPLLAPILCARLVYDAAVGRLLAPVTPVEIACSTLWCFLSLAGAAAIVWPLVVGMSRRRLTRLWPSLLLLPLWMLMLSLAAWRALIELWRRPFHWEKTEHGLSARDFAHGAEEVSSLAPASGEQPLFE